MHHLKRKYRLMFMSSWLIAKLLGSVELSRLVITRFFPRAHIQKIARRDLLQSPTEWIFEPPFLYTLTLDENKNNFVFTKVSEIVRN